VPNSNLPEVTNPYADLESRLDQLPVFDIEELQARTIVRILSASSLNEVLADPTAQGLADYADQVVYLVAIAGALPSAYDTGPTRYMVMDIADPQTGEHHMVTTGSPYVMAAAFKAADLGELPCLVRVLQLESKNNAGRTSHWIVKP